MPSNLAIRLFDPTHRPYKNRCERARARVCVCVCVSVCVRVCVRVGVLGLWGV